MAQRLVALPRGPRCRRRVAQISFAAPAERRPVQAAVDASTITLNGGALLLRGLRTPREKRKPPGQDAGPCSDFLSLRSESSILALSRPAYAEGSGSRRQDWPCLGSPSLPDQQTSRGLSDFRLRRIAPPGPGYRRSPCPPVPRWHLHR